MNAGSPPPRPPSSHVGPASEERRPLRGEPDDPNKATLLHILRLLNQAEDEFDEESEKGLELIELEYRLESYWAVKSGEAKLPVILQLLVDNKMVDHLDGGNYSWIRKRQIQGIYRITEEGKLHLLKNVTDEGRIE